MLEKNDQMLNIIPVAPEDKLEKNIENIEFGFEHELIEAENKVENNSFENINSALIKTYGKKVFKLNPYNDLDPVSIENVNIQLNDSNGFLNGEVKAKVLDETLNDRSNFIKTPLINDIIVDYEVDKTGCQKRYDYTIELLNNENNKELKEAQAEEYQDIHSSTEEIGLQDLDEAKQLAEEIAEQRNELENKISNFDEVQTYISNDIETSPIIDSEPVVELDKQIEPTLEIEELEEPILKLDKFEESIETKEKQEIKPTTEKDFLQDISLKDIAFDIPKVEEDVIDIRYQLENASVNYYIFNKYKEKTVVKEEIIEPEEPKIIEKVASETKNIVEPKPIEQELDITYMLEENSIKFYEEHKQKIQEAIQKDLAEALGGVLGRLTEANRIELEKIEQERLEEEARLKEERQRELARKEAEKQKELERIAAEEEKRIKAELENQIVDDILTSIEESCKIEEARKRAEECDLRIPSDVYILSVQNFIPLPEEPTPEVKAKMDRDKIDMENRLDELPIIIFRGEDEEVEDKTQELADSYEQALEYQEELNYYTAPTQDFNMDDTLGRVSENNDFENENKNDDILDSDFSTETLNSGISSSDIEEAFFNIKTLNESVEEVEKEANELGLISNYDPGISIAKAAKIEALVEKKKAERKIRLAEERLQAELEKQQIEERIKSIQDKINRVKQMSLADFDEDEILLENKPTINQEITEEQTTDYIETPIQEEIEISNIETAAAVIPKVETTVELSTRKRGRPPGSKNKKTLLKEARERRKLEKLGLTEMPVVKRKRGRPLGSKNKKSKK